MPLNPTEQQALDAANAVKAWYKRSSFWGQAAAGALIWQAVRVGLHFAFGWHV